MEKKKLGVRKRQPPPGKRRRKAGAAAAGRGLAKAVAAYLVSDSYMYAPLVGDSSPAAAAAEPPEKAVPVAHKYKGCW